MVNIYCGSRPLMKPFLSKSEGNAVEFCMSIQCQFHLNYIPNKIKYFIDLPVLTFFDINFCNINFYHQNAFISMQRPYIYCIFYCLNNPYMDYVPYVR